MRERHRVYPVIMVLNPGYVIKYINCVISFLNVVIGNRWQKFTGQEAVEIRSLREVGEALRLFFYSSGKRFNLLKLRTFFIFLNFFILLKKYNNQR